VRVRQRADHARKGRCERGSVQHHGANAAACAAATVVRGAGRSAGPAGQVFARPSERRSARAPLQLLGQRDDVFGHEAHAHVQPVRRHVGRGQEVPQRVALPTQLAQRAEGRGWRARAGTRQHGVQRLHQREQGELRRRVSDQGGRQRRRHHAPARDG
jgi:hypothetical protein